MTVPSTQTQHLGHNDRGGERPGLLLTVVLAGQFMTLLDLFIVNVAAPTIRTELHASGAGLQLIIAGYTITYAVLLITGARLGHVLGHRRAYLGGMALFTAASLACGLASGTGELITFRLIQGAGAAVMIPQVLSMIQRNFTGEHRKRALSAYSAVLATGAAAGQVVGGVLVSADLFGETWRPVFLVNVPIGLALLALGGKFLPRDQPGGEARSRGFDPPGLVLLGAAVTSFTVPLVLGQEEGWPVWSWILLAASAVLFGAFLAHESRLARNGGAPLIAPRVLRIPGMGLATARIVLVMSINTGFFFAISLYVQGSLHYTALHSGLAFFPTAVAFGLVGLTWRHWAPPLQRFLIPGGFVLTALSATAMGFVLRYDGDGGVAMYATFVGLGAGLSLGFSPTLTGALATVRQEDAADASGLLVTVTQIGAVVGVATYGTLFLNRVAVRGAEGPADAMLVTTLALAGGAVLALLAGTVKAVRGKAAQGQPG
jgi:EmrB/QacA subfamily drug resistance transporter